MTRYQVILQDVHGVEVGRGVPHELMTQAVVEGEMHARMERVFYAIYVVADDVTTPWDDLRARYSVHNQWEASRGVV